VDAGRGLQPRPAIDARLGLFMRLKEVTKRITSLDSLDHILNIILEEVVPAVERGGSCQ